MSDNKPHFGGIPDLWPPFANQTAEQAIEARERIIIAWLRKPSEDGVDCSADREALAQRLERKEHLK